MLITGFVKAGNFVIWLKVIESYGRLIIGSGYNFLYSLYLFVLFFPHKSHRFSILLIIIFILGNWYVYLIFFRVLWIFGCPCNGCSCISCISCSCNFRGICNLSFFFFCCSLCFRICWYKSSLLLAYIIMLTRLLYRKWPSFVCLKMVWLTGNCFSSMAGYLFMAFIRPFFNLFR